MIELLRICRGQHLDPHATLASLLHQGYQRVAKVSEPGDCALRGGILDLFPEGFEAPVRIELNHETVESIQSVHPVTGEPFLPHEMVIVLPAAPLRRPPLKASVAHLFLGEEAPLDPFVDIHAGELVVHVTHGIGRYLGLKKVRVKDQLREHVVLEYEGGDRLYVPLGEIHLLQKYIGLEGRGPKLSRLGTRTWARMKELARRGAASIAFELLSLQARRLSAAGHAFKADTDWQKELEASFPYRETAGQSRAVEEVKRDMETPRPMDRLLCGDVGYGKTEVALRAAFKAVMDGRQVALLCPTTILAEQHFSTFSSRMRAFPVSVAMLSRFQSEGEQSRVLEGLRQGTVDIAIGTHRLLSGDVGFKDLGLVIIDEEQRFGVRHKERLKRFRTEVDVLTLTATPIPRTLYLALMGARSMSLIETPPFERLPVKTVVSEEGRDLIRQAISKELARSGQIFCIHPWIEGIPALHRKIRSCAPEARISVAHGQMPSRALEKAMLSFMRREADLLISTAIVESGIDIPNANTLLVFRAESFGLADLYQLRGRVGRFTRQAHAYFFTPKGLLPTPEAQRRLRALEEFSSLGAGFQIALQDLQLRGAGNLLGIEQHGHVMAVGFDLYCRLLKSEIERHKRI
ncbi:MAG: DEAD/DEAH box helicase [Candidatus Omnitrophica bacterium]|nr:DEAD/DEAH box helicase [Candidatus Omnitrophota bacterium]